MRKLWVFAALTGLMFAITACNSALTSGQGGPTLSPQGAKSSIDVVKTANTPTWTISKQAFDASGNPVSTATLPQGSSTTFQYKVVASRTQNSPSGNAYEVWGTITITNNQSTPSTINSVSDVMTDPSGSTLASTTVTGTATWLKCPSLPTTLAAAYGGPGGSIQCTYDYTFPSSSLPPLGTTLTNTGTAGASWQTTNAGTQTGDFKGSASFSFASATTTPSIADNVTCPTGFTCTKSHEQTVTSDSGAVVTYTYDLTVDNVSAQCGQHVQVDNVASITGSSTSASYSIDVYTGDCGTTPPPTGCTYTQGYWKTHSIYGPAGPANDTWNDVVPNGPDSLFFQSGISWIDLFKTAPKGGNAYIQLAHQYMAAWLNVKAGASVPSDVQAALSWAQTYFNESITTGGSYNTPSNYTDAQDARKYAEILDNYNNGKDGVPHCS